MLQIAVVDLGMPLDSVVQTFAGVAAHAHRGRIAAAGRPTVRISGGHRSPTGGLRHYLARSARHPAPPKQPFADHAQSNRSPFGTANHRPIQRDRAPKAKVPSIPIPMLQPGYLEVPLSVSCAPVARPLTARRYGAPPYPERDHATQRCTDIGLEGNQTNRMGDWSASSHHLPMVASIHRFPITKPSQPSYSIRPSRSAYMDGGSSQTPVVSLKVTSVTLLLPSHVRRQPSKN